MKRLNFRYITLMVLLLWGAVALRAQSVQDFTCSHLGRVEGMLSQRVYSILQTSDGALWWATKGGGDVHDCFNLVMDLSKELGSDALLNALLVTVE